MTAEDPVEYNLKGVNQVQVNEGIGRTFAAVLRSFLRQDPDVILVGETRDLETAQIGIRAALTGHLVLHHAAHQRLPVDGGAAASTWASRRSSCPPRCCSSWPSGWAARSARTARSRTTADEESLVPYGHVPQGLGKVTFYKGKGCQTCNFTGMKGRVAHLRGHADHRGAARPDPQDASTAEIRNMAQRAGMKTLRQAGLSKVLEGITTVEEILRVTLG